MGLFGKNKKDSVKDTHEQLLAGAPIEMSSGVIPDRQHDFTVNAGPGEDSYEERAAAAMMNHIADDQQKAQLTAVLQQEGKAVAISIAKNAGLQAKELSGKALNELSKYIEQGPDGVRVLAFVGGGACTVISGLVLINPFGILTAPLHYLIC